MPAPKKQKITLWEFFQSLGKTFMLPVALLSFCGIMLGIGSSLSSRDVITLMPFIGHPAFQLLFTWMSKIGSFAFSFLPVMFAIAIPLGMARENKGVAAFSGFVGFAVLNLATNFYLTTAGILPTTDPLVLKANNIQNILGIQSIDTGILGAVIVGIIVYLLHERFNTIRLPDALAFFGGTRFVPIVTTLVLGLCGLVIPLIWPWFAAGINGLGWVINGAGAFGPMIFGTGERLLLPFGLHHILVALIRFTEAGGTLDVCGHSVSGALTIFQAQLSCPTTTGFAESATRFLSQGKMPAFLGGLPGAALAMYHCAKPENRHKIKGLLISGVVACVVGGTTEPIEFLFLFVAPFLYFIHAILTGLGFTVMALLGVTIGNTDGNIIDFVVFGILHGTATKWYLVPIVAAIWFAAYYAIFRFSIQRFNIKTPGRESETAGSQSAPVGAVGKSGYNVPAILAALGGSENIVSLDNCITRLRLSVDDMSKVDDAALKANRAIGVVHLNEHNLQVVIGPQVQSVKDELDSLIAAAQPAAAPQERLMFDFSTPVDRHGTWCTQWDYIADRFGHDDLLPFTISDMDFATAPCIIEALQQRLQHGVLGYSRWQHEDFLGAVRHWYQQRFATAVDTNMAVYGPSVIYMVAQLIRQWSAPGEYVVTHTPAYDAFYKVILGNQRQLLACPLHKQGNDWLCDMAHLEALLARPQTKILLLCSPQNPTGKVWRAEELQQMAELCERHDVRVISDEIHMDMVWGENRHTPWSQVATTPWALLTSGSKTFNIPALTGAYGFISDDASREAYFQQLKARDGLSSPAVLAVAAHIAAYRHGEPWLDALRDYLQDNLTYVAERLNQAFPALAWQPPQSTYLAWIDLRPLGIDDRQLQQVLIEREKVAIMPGFTYGEEGRGFLRLNVGCPRSKLEAGMDKLINGLKFVLDEV